MSDGCVDVTVKHCEDIHEVSVRVPLRATLSEVKLMLARQLNRPEIMQNGKFVVTLPNGDRKTIMDSQKLGPRRNLFFNGAPLYPPPEELPPITLEDFDPYDEEQIIESPRSIRACEAEGVDPEELFYLPMKAHAQRGLPKRIVQLRHDFFEALRQDTVDIVRRARQLIIDGEDNLWQDSVTARRCIGAGPLDPHHYPLAHQVFEDLRGMLDMDKLYERPKQLKCKINPNAGNRWAPGGATKWESDPDKPAHITMYLTSKDADIDREVVQWASEDCAKQLAKLKKLPAGKEEKVSGLPLRSENMVVGQLNENHKRLRKAHRSTRDTLNKQVECAAVQMDLADWHLEDIKLLKEQRVKTFKGSMSPWTNGLQTENAERAGKQEEHWLGKRADIHEMELEKEDKRREDLQRLTKEDLDRQKRVATMRDLAKIHFARTWTDRRTSWGKNSLSVGKGVEAFNGLVKHKHAEASARVEDQKFRLQCHIDFKREMKALRKSLTDMTAEREQKRQQYRRQVVSEEFSRMGEDSKATAGQTGPRNRLTSSMGRPDATQRRFPRFDWGRFGAETAMAQTTSSFMSAGATARVYSKQHRLPTLSNTARSASEPSLTVGLLKGSLCPDHIESFRSNYHAVRNRPVEA